MNLSQAVPAPSAVNGAGLKQVQTTRMHRMHPAWCIDKRQTRKTNVSYAFCIVHRMHPAWCIMQNAYDASLSSEPVIRNVCFASLNTGVSLGKQKNCIVLKCFV